MSLSNPSSITYDSNTEYCQGVDRQRYTYLAKRLAKFAAPLG
jgi:hypothetical protein